MTGVALWAELLHRLGLAHEADRLNLRPIGPGGSSDWGCYLAVVETRLAVSGFLSDRSLLADEATQAFRCGRAIPSHPTLHRFLAEADLARAQKAATANRAMLRGPWATGAAPTRGY